MSETNYKSVLNGIRFRLLEEHPEFRPLHQAAEGLYLGVQRQRKEVAKLRKELYAVSVTPPLEPWVQPLLLAALEELELSSAAVADLLRLAESRLASCKDHTSHRQYLDLQRSSKQLNELHKSLRNLEKSQSQPDDEASSNQ